MRPPARFARSAPAPGRSPLGPLAAGLVAVGLLTLAGCGDDPAPGGGTVSFAARLVTADGASVVGVKVVPVDAADGRVVASPATSGPDGGVFWEAPAPAGLRYLVIGAGAWSVVAQEDWLGAVPTARMVPVAPMAPMAPATATAPLRVTRIVLAPEIVGDGLPRLAGEVRDALTGAPLDRVLIGDEPWPTAFGGATAASADATGPDGRFTVGEVFFARHPVTGALSQVAPLFVGREGYRPRAWTHDPGTDDSLDYSGLVIALEPLGPQDTGALAGRVLRNGVPAAGVAVGLGGAADPVAKTGFGIPGQVTRTDAAGRYLFTGLAPGLYVAYPGFLAGDGVLLPAQAAARPWTVPADSTVTADDLVVLVEITPARPAAADRIARGPLIVAWPPVPGATAYEVSLDGAQIATTDTITIIYDIPAELPAGLHGLRIVARDGATVLGATERSHPFLVVD